MRNVGYKGPTSISEMYHSNAAHHKALENLPPLHRDFAVCDTLELIQAISPEVALVKRNLENKQYLDATIPKLIQALEAGKYQKNSMEILYLLHRITKEEIDQYLGEGVNQMPDNYRKIFMTAALHYKREGIQAGLQRGLQRGEKERTFTIAKKMLTAGSDLSFIEKITGLSMNTIKKLKIA